MINNIDNLTPNAWQQNGVETQISNETNNGNINKSNINRPTVAKVSLLVGILGVVWVACNYFNITNPLNRGEKITELEQTLSNICKNAVFNFSKPLHDAKFCETMLSTNKKLNDMQRDVVFSYCRQDVSTKIHLKDYLDLSWVPKMLFVNSKNHMMHCPVQLKAPKGQSCNDVLLKEDENNTELMCQVNTAELSKNFMNCFEYKVISRTGFKPSVFLKGKVSETARAIVSKFVEATGQNMPSNLNSDEIRFKVTFSCKEN